MHHTTPTRRAILGALALAPMAVAAARADDGAVAPDALLAPPPLPDAWIGRPDAPTTVVEYASMTCTHCAAFHAASWPALRRDWVEAGKVRFALRDYPLDPLASAAAMLGRARGLDAREAILGGLYDAQASWAFVASPVEALKAEAAMLGVDAALFDATLHDQGLYDALKRCREDAEARFAVRSTPTFFVNGRRHVGEVRPDDLKAVFG